jgi:hypothetical protein
VGENRYTLSEKFAYSGSGASRDEQGGVVTDSCSITIPHGAGYEVGGPESLPVKRPRSIDFGWTLGEPPVHEKSGGPMSGCSGLCGPFVKSYGLPYPADPDMNALFTSAESRQFSYVLGDSITVPVSQLPCEKSLDFVDHKANYTAPGTPELLQTIDLHVHGTLSISELNTKRKQRGIHERAARPAHAHRERGSSWRCT